MSMFSWENFLGHLFAKCFGSPQMKQEHFVWEGFLNWWGLDLCPFLYEMLSQMNFLLLGVLLLKYFWEFLFLFACFWVWERFLYFILLSIDSLYSYGVYITFLQKPKSCFLSVLWISIWAHFSLTIIYVYTILGPVTNLGEFSSFFHSNSISLPNCPARFLKYLSQI